MTDNVNCPYCNRMNTINDDCGFNGDHTNYKKCDHCEKFFSFEIVLPYAYESSRLEF